MSRPERIDVCGIPVDNMTMVEALEHIGQNIDQGVKSSYVVTPNADVIVLLQKDKEFRRIYDGADLVLVDGMSLIWAGKYLNTPFREKVSGSDLFVHLCEACAKKGHSVYFMGARPGVAQKAAEILQKTYPGLKVAGTYSPTFGFDKKEDENKMIVQMIREAKPDILFLGLGSPKQEKWIDKYRLEVQVPVSISVGISFDYVAGTVRRAPVFMQRIGLEWFWRLLMEPRRLWKRYLVDDPVFFSMVWKQKAASKTEKAHAQS